MSGTFIDKQNVLKNLTPIVSMGVSQGGLIWFHPSAELFCDYQTICFMFFKEYF